MNIYQHKTVVIGSFQETRVATFQERQHNGASMPKPNAEVEELLHRSKKKSKCQAAGDSMVTGMTKEAVVAKVLR